MWIGSTNHVTINMQRNHQNNSFTFFMQQTAIQKRLITFHRTRTFAVTDKPEQRAFKLTHSLATATIKQPQSCQNTTYIILRHRHQSIQRHRKTVRWPRWVKKDVAILLPATKATIRWPQSCQNIVCTWHTFQHRCQSIQRHKIPGVCVKSVSTHRCMLCL